LLLYFENDYIQVILCTTDHTRYSIDIINVALREVLKLSLTDVKIDIFIFKSSMYFIQLLSNRGSFVRSRLNKVSTSVSCSAILNGSISLRYFNHQDQWKSQYIFSSERSAKIALVS
jgi:hypothetical protein